MMSQQDAMKTENDDNLDERVEWIQSFNYKSVQVMATERKLPANLKKSDIARLIALHDIGDQTRLNHLLSDLRGTRSRTRRAHGHGPSPTSSMRGVPGFVTTTAEADSATASPYVDDEDDLYSPSVDDDDDEDSDPSSKSKKARPSRRTAPTPSKHARRSSYDMACQSPPTAPQFSAPQGHLSGHTSGGLPGLLSVHPSAYAEGSTGHTGHPGGHLNLLSTQPGARPGMGPTVRTDAEETAKTKKPTYYRQQTACSSGARFSKTGRAIKPRRDRSFVYSKSSHLASTVRYPSSPTPTSGFRQGMSIEGSGFEPSQVADTGSSFRPLVSYAHASASGTIAASPPLVSVGAFKQWSTPLPVPRQRLPSMQLAFGRHTDPGKHFNGQYPQQTVNGLSPYSYPPQGYADIMQTHYAPNINQSAPRNLYSNPKPMMQFGSNIENSDYRSLSVVDPACNYQSHIYQPNQLQRPSALSYLPKLDILNYNTNLHNPEAQDSNCMNVLNNDVSLTVHHPEAPYILPPFTNQNDSSGYDSSWKASQLVKPIALPAVPSNDCPANGYISASLECYYNVKSDHLHMPVQLSPYWKPANTTSVNSYVTPISFGGSHPSLCQEAIHGPNPRSDFQSRQNLSSTPSQVVALHEMRQTVHGMSASNQDMLHSSQHPSEVQLSMMNPSVAHYNNAYSNPTTGTYQEPETWQLQPPPQLQPPQQPQQTPPQLQPLQQPQQTPQPHAQSFQQLQQTQHTHQPQLQPAQLMQKTQQPQIQQSQETPQPPLLQPQQHRNHNSEDQKYQQSIKKRQIQQQMQPKQLVAQNQRKRQVPKSPYQLAQVNRQSTFQGYEKKPHQSTTHPQHFIPNPMKQAVTMKSTNLIQLQQNSPLVQSQPRTPCQLPSALEHPVTYQSQHPGTNHHQGDYYCQSAITENSHGPDLKKPCYRPDQISQLQDSIKPTSPYQPVVQEQPLQKSYEPASDVPLKDVSPITFSEFRGQNQELSFPLIYDFLTSAEKQLTSLRSKEDNAAQFSPSNCKSAENISSALIEEVLPTLTQHILYSKTNEISLLTMKAVEELPDAPEITVAGPPDTPFHCEAPAIDPCFPEDCPVSASSPIDCNPSLPAVVSPSANLITKPTPSETIVKEDEKMKQVVFLCSDGSGDFEYMTLSVSQDDAPDTTVGSIPGTLPVTPSTSGIDNLNNVSIEEAVSPNGSCSPSLTGSNSSHPSQVSTLLVSSSDTSTESSSNISDYLSSTQVTTDFVNDVGESNERSTSIPLSGNVSTAVAESSISQDFVSDAVVGSEASEAFSLQVRDTTLSAMGFEHQVRLSGVHESICQLSHIQVTDDNVVPSLSKSIQVDQNGMDIEPQVPTMSKETSEASEDNIILRTVPSEHKEPNCSEVCKIKTEGFSETDTIKVTVEVTQQEDLEDMIKKDYLSDNVMEVSSESMAMAGTNQNYSDEVPKIENLSKSAYEFSIVQNVVKDEPIDLSKEDEAPPQSPEARSISPNEQVHSTEEANETGTVCHVDLNSDCSSLKQDKVVLPDINMNTVSQTSGGCSVQDKLAVPDINMNTIRQTSGGCSVQDKLALPDVNMNTISQVSAGHSVDLEHTSDIHGEKSPSSAEDFKDDNALNSLLLRSKSGGKTYPGKQVRQPVRCSPRTGGRSLSYSFHSSCMSQKAIPLRIESAMQQPARGRKPCPNAEHGCLMVLPPAQLSSHHLVCEYTYIQCPAIGCGWECIAKKLSTHIREAHRAEIGTGTDSEHTVSFQEIGQQHLTFLREVSRKLFVICLHAFGNSIYASIQYIASGRSEKPITATGVLEVIDRTRGGSHHWRGKIGPIQQQLAYVRENGNCLQVTPDRLGISPTSTITLHTNIQVNLSKSQSLPASSSDL